MAAVWTTTKKTIDYACGAIGFASIWLAYYFHTFSASLFVAPNNDYIISTCLTMKWNDIYIWALAVWHASDSSRCSSLGTFVRRQPSAARKAHSHSTWQTKWEQSTLTTISTSTNVEISKEHDSICYYLQSNHFTINSFCWNDGMLIRVSQCQWWNGKSAMSQIIMDGASFMFVYHCILVFGMFTALFCAIS